MWCPVSCRRSLTNSQRNPRRGSPPCKAVSTRQEAMEGQGLCARALLWGQQDRPSCGLPGRCVCGRWTAPAPTLRPSWTLDCRGRWLGALKLRAAQQASRTHQAHDSSSREQMPPRPVAVTPRGSRGLEWARRMEPAGAWGAVPGLCRLDSCPPAAGALSSVLFMPSCRRGAES